MKTNDQNSHSLENEWCLLQNQFDSYEKFSLLIKLVNTAILSVAYFSNQLTIIVIIILLILWMQDAIWKTFQSRIEIRLLAIETSLNKGEALKAYQFNFEYEKNRPGIFGLVKEYLCQAVRPTIAYPHLFLLLVSAYQVFL